MASHPQSDLNTSTSDQVPDGYVLPKSSTRVSPAQEKQDRNAATALIRKKLDKLYADEPDAEEELEEVETIKEPSKHQLFMQQLSDSGKSLAEIQTQWHHYYVTLPDSEKHEVWKEFYASNEHVSKYHRQAKPHVSAPAITNAAGSGVVVHDHQPKMLAIHPAPNKQDHRTPKTIKRTILSKVNAGGKLKAKHHVQSLLFGLSMGFVVILIFLFGFFNEVIIAPFIQPSRHASATPPYPEQ